jgi:hypothetical protein
MGQMAFERVMRRTKPWRSENGNVILISIHIHPEVTLAA